MDPNLGTEWGYCKQLISCLAPDFATFLWNGKLDREAIQDCASFMQAAIGKKLDRNANCWGMLLYFMLVTNFTFQADRGDQAEVLEWVVRSVTKTSYELNNHHSTLDQFVLSVAKVMATRTNPLGQEHETIFWHNYRTMCSPHAPIFAAKGQWVAFRLESVVPILQRLLGKPFSVSELYRLVDEGTWTVKGRSSFYDCMCGWPIAESHESSTGARTLIPLKETDLDEGSVKEFRAAFFRKDKWDEIVNGVDKAGSDIDYESIVIKSSNSEIGRYNFYMAVCMDGWFGYRTTGQSNFRFYLGAENEMMLDARNRVIVQEEVEQMHRDLGLKPVEHFLKSATLLDYYSHDFPDPDQLPPAYLSCAFKMRDDDEDTLFMQKYPPWFDAWFAPGGFGVVIHKDSVTRAEYLMANADWGQCEEDMQTAEEGDPTVNRQDPGSSPALDSQVSSEDLIGSPVDEDLSDSEKVTPRHCPTQAPKKRPTPTPFAHRRTGDAAASAATSATPPNRCATHAVSGATSSPGSSESRWSICLFSILASGYTFLTDCVSFVFSSGTLVSASRSITALACIVLSSMSETSISLCMTETGTFFVRTAAELGSVSIPRMNSPIAPAASDSYSSRDTPGTCTEMK